MKKSKTKQLSTAAMLLAVGLILPFAAAHGLGMQGTVLLPMHIPVLLAGLLCGPWYGLLLGIITPMLNSVLTGMPAFYPQLPLMLAELAVYGVISGVLYHKTPLRRSVIGLYLSLLISMVCGRLAYAAVFRILLFAGECKALTTWGALVTGLPGILVQVLLIPPIVLALKRISTGAERSGLTSAKNLIAEETAVCVVLQDGIIVRTEKGRGVAPVLQLLDEGILQGSTVVDKVIGKATAMILSHGGCDACHAGVISEPALSWLKEHDIAVTYETCVPLIQNRTGDGVCPMEQTVQNIDDAERAIAALREKLK